MNILDLGPELNSLFWLLLKIGTLIGLSIYIVFALVIVRQVHQMTTTLEVGFEIPVRLLSWAHLLFALATFVIAFMIL